MMKICRSIGIAAAGLVLCLSVLCGTKLDAEASARKNCLDSLNAGITSVINPGSVSTAEEAIAQLTRIAEAAEPDSDEDDALGELVMANVSSKLNIRADASEDSDKVGYLYKDCGGRILDQKDGWTKIKSGDLVGWAKDEYLLFGEEAEELAAEVGNQVVVVTGTDSVRVREEPGLDGAVVGLLVPEDSLEYLDTVDEDWVSVDYEGETCYVSARYTELDFQIDAGETLKAVQKREEEEAAAKQQAALTANQGAVMANADEVRLLAALIYCEAGREPYEGQLAVGAVVMNRVRSAAYPDTMYGVIYASGQFTPAGNGKVATVYNGNGITASCFQAAEAAIAGETNVGTATHFRRAGNHSGLVIGNQVFW